MGANFDVLAVGDYCLDLIFAGLTENVEPGKEVFAPQFEMLPGGSYNAVIAMHRLGVRVGWAADFGSDLYSQYVIDQAQAEGLDQSLFVRHKQPIRRVTASASTAEDRAFLTHYDSGPQIPAAMKALVTTSARILYVPALFYGAALDAGLALARMRRMALVMDGNSQVETLQDPAVCKALRACEIFMPNSREIRRISGEQDLEKAMRVVGEICPCVVVKDGRNGAYALQSGQMAYAAAIPVAPVDTTGAGDCFNAGFLKAWLDHCPIEECLRWGNVVGGLSTTAMGGPGRKISPADVLPWLKAPGS
jgi:sugar/nucleoside kinase (ribokinase family)